MRTINPKKLSITAGVALMLLAGNSATVAVAQSGAGELSASDIMAKTRAAYAALTSYCDDGKAVNEFSGKKLRLTFSLRLERPNSYRIDWTQETGLKGVAWSDGGANNLRSEPTSSPAVVETKPDLKSALQSAAVLTYSAAATIPSAFFAQKCGDLFVYPAIAGRYPLKKEADDAVGDVDCYVVSAEMDLSKAPNAGKSGTAFTALWIGKNDFLVHKCRARYVEKVDESAMSSDQAIDEAIKRSLQAQNKPVTPEAVAAMRPQMREIMKQVNKTLKAGFQAGVVMTQTHEHILVNQNFSPSDFTR